jgi:hypothetical protein
VADETATLAWLTCRSVPANGRIAPDDRTDLERFLLELLEEEEFSAGGSSTEHFVPFFNLIAESLP